MPAWDSLVFSRAERWLVYDAIKWFLATNKRRTEWYTVVISLLKWLSVAGISNFLFTKSMHPFVIILLIFALISFPGVINLFNNFIANHKSCSWYRPLCFIAHHLGFFFVHFHSILPSFFVNFFNISASCTLLQSCPAITLSPGGIF